MQSESISPTKTCTKCGQGFPPSAAFFYRNSTLKDGLDSACKKCRSNQGKRWREEHLEHDRARQRDHEREMRKQHPDLARQRCKRYRESHREQRRQETQCYRDAHREQVLAATSRWRRENPEQSATYARNRVARKKGNGGSHTDADVRAQYTRQRGRCYYCGEKVGDTYHVDHVTPLALGGSNGPENLVIACPACNQSKHAKHPMDFAGRLF